MHCEVWRLRLSFLKFTSCSCYWVSHKKTYILSQFLGILTIPFPKYSIKYLGISFYAFYSYLLSIPPFNLAQIFTLSLFTPISWPLFFNNPLSTICAAHIVLSVGTSSGESSPTRGYILKEN